MALGIIAAVVSLVSAGASYVQARNAAKQAKRAADAARGVLVNKESNIEPLPVIYGERRVGGTRVFVSTGGASNTYLYIALALCEGEVEDIYGVQLDDVPLGDVRFNGKFFIEYHYGTDDQAASTILSEANGWTSDHRLQGVAYIALRLTWDENVFSGIPNITAVVKGRKVYDPRDETTAWSDNPALCLRDYLTSERYGKGLDDAEIDDAAFAQAADDCEESVTLYEDGSTGQLFQCNMVVDTDKEIFDNTNLLLTGCRGFLPYSAQGVYSLKIDKSSSSEFDFTTDHIVGGLQIRGESKSEKFNRITVKFPNSDANWQPDVAIWPPAGSAEEIQFLAEDGGELLHEEIELETITNYYQARDLARIICLRSRNALRTSFTSTSEALQLTVGDVCTVSHPTPGWNKKPFQVEEIALNYDGTCEVSLLEYDSSIYTWEVGSQAQSYPDTDLPNPFSVSPPTNLAVVETTTLANDGTLLPSLRVTWDAPNDSFVSRYEIQWLRTSELEDYGSIGDDFTEQEDWGAIDDAADSTLDYGLITTPIDSGDPEYNTAFSTTTQYVIKGVEPFANVSIRVRAINALGVKSTFIGTSSIPSGDTTPPGLPASVAAAGGLREITITWINPSAVDFSYVEIWENTTNSFGSASMIGVSAGSSFSRTGLGYNVTRYYWLIAVDYSGNKSGRTNSVHATTLFVDSDAFSQEVMNLFSEAGAYGIEPVSSLPAAGDFDGQIKYRTTDKTLWRWDAASEEWTDDIFSISAGSVTAASFAAGIEPVGIVTELPNPVGYTGPKMVILTTDEKLYRYDSEVPEFTKAIPVEDLDGEITETQIADDAITTPKLAAGAVQADNLAANSVTAGKVAAGAIAATALQSNIIDTQHLRAGAVETDKIAANSITGGLIAATGVITSAAQIDNLVVTGAKIGNLAVTQGKIANAAVDTLKIAGEAVTVPRAYKSEGVTNITNTFTLYEVGAVNVPFGSVAPSAVQLIATVKLNIGTTTHVGIRLKHGTTDVVAFERVCFGLDTITISGIATSVGTGTQRFSVEVSRSSGLPFAVNNISLSATGVRR